MLTARVMVALRPSNVNLYSYDVPPDRNLTALLGEQRSLLVAKFHGDDCKVVLVCPVDWKRETECSEGESGRRTSCPSEPGQHRDRGSSGDWLVAVAALTDTADVEAINAQATVTALVLLKVKRDMAHFLSDGQANAGRSQSR